MFYTVRHSSDVESTLSATPAHFKMAPQKRQRGVEWDEFDYVEDNGQHKILRVACNYCASNVSASTANMRTHLRNCKKRHADHRIVI
uniref:BED-type domain-containing protein n=1 Tax=Peronospora matthiolae TaxID=2874970 RepID=A0AAV1UUH1_9STRA